MKQVIIYEKRSAIAKFVQQTLQLIGYNDFKIVTNINEVDDFQNTVLVVADIVEINEISRKIKSNNAQSKLILYQVEHENVVGFWNEGLINQNHDFLPVDDNKSMFIRARGRLEKIEKQDILYVESDKKYCTIITKTKKYVLRTALKNLYEQLKDNNFIRIHRSYLINKNHITHIDTQNQNILIGEKEISIGRYYQENLFSKIAVLQ